MKRNGISARQFKIMLIVVTLLMLANFLISNFWVIGLLAILGGAAFVARAVTVQRKKLE